MRPTARSRLSLLITARKKSLLSTFCSTLPGALFESAGARPSCFPFLFLAQGRALLRLVESHLCEKIASQGMSARAAAALFLIAAAPRDECINFYLSRIGSLKKRGSKFQLRSVYVLTQACSWVSECIFKDFASPFSCATFSLRSRRE